jgi:hypothetical protein
MKNSRIIVTALFLLIGVSFLTSIPFANAFSETFPLVQSASVSRIVSVDAGDRLVGDFTISNIPTWRDSYTGDPTTVQYAFRIAKIEGTEYSPMDVGVFEATQEEHSSFDITCEWTGNYILRFNVGSGNPTTGIGNMKATLNYQVVKPTPTSPPISESKPDEIPNWLIPTVLIALIFIIAIVAVYSVRRSKRKVP